MTLHATVKMVFTTPLAFLMWGICAGALALLRVIRFLRGGAADTRSALVVSWEFPPCASTGVHLPASIVRHAHDAGWHVQVVCGPAPRNVSAGGEDLARLVPSGVEVARVPRALADDGQVHFHPAWTIPSIDGGFLAALAMAVTAAIVFFRSPPALVIGSGPRFANFAAARRLASVFGAKLLLQYRDEWTVNTPDFVTATRFDRAEELRCLTRADVVSFVSDGKRTAYCRGFPHIDPAKFITTPNGWEPYFHDRARLDTNHLPKESGTFALTYTGRYHRSLASLLQSCDNLLARRPDLARLRLIFVGEQLPDNKRLIADFARRHPKTVIDLPATAPTTAIEVQRESSALLLVNDHVYDGVVPLKTFDYLRSGQPILVFGQTGGAAEIVDRLDAGVTVPAGDDQALETALTRLMSSNRPWDTPARKSWCERHNRRELVMEMLAAAAASLDSSQPERGTLPEDPCEAEVSPRAIPL
ncbi:MAG: glycosyltransferase [Rhodospirillaceae bacterium]